jgi:serine/threonine-protein kinase
MAATNAGVILGTAAYMSPEQAKGRTVDRRTDIFAFGAVLYEMLTGRPAFDGEDVADTLAAVLKSEPDWHALPSDLPSMIRTLVEHCLAKDRKLRIADISTARFLLNEPTQLGSAAVRVLETMPPSGRMSRRALIFAAASLAIAVIAIASAVWMATRHTLAPARAVARFSVVLPPNASLFTGLDRPAIALSPDGARLVYVARVGSGGSQIYSRAIDQLDAVPIRGTEGASGPFFSPDGQWIGFLSDDGKLKKVPIAGGLALTLCDAINMQGATWLPDDSIVFRPGAVKLGLWRVHAAGGTPQEFMEPDNKSEVGIFWPEVLPGGKAILFTIRRSGGDFNSAAIGVLRLDSRERLVLVEGGTNPHYLSSGHLVFARGGEILAVPFDVDTLRVSGTPIPVIEDVLTNPAAGWAQFTASGGGSIAYIPGGEAQDTRSLVWVDNRGAAQPVPAPKRNYEFPRLSPDGQRLAVRISGGSDSGTDIWLYQFSRGTLSRFTSKANDAETPVWTPDGKRVTYMAPGQIRWKLADGSAGEEVLAGSDRHLHLGGWSPKGDALVARASDTGNIWVLQMNDKKTLRPLVQTPYRMRAATISPDGRWLAYASNDTNRFEVYVQAFPNPGAKYQISRDGGTEPLWAKSGLKLFYRNGDKMMSVAIDAKGDDIEARVPTLLFEGRFAASPGTMGDAWYDVSPDGQRFLMLRDEETPNSTASIVMVQDWTTELKRLAPTK